MKALTGMFAAVCVLLSLLLPVAHAGDAKKATRLTLEAKEQLDTHFGSAAHLERAAELLTQALAENEKDAAIYVQAARLVVKGGHLVSLKFQPGTIDAYSQLLDRALALDPKNAKALILKAEYFHLEGNFPQELAHLNKAQATGTEDRWLLVGFGRYWWKGMEQEESAKKYYAKVRALGPGANTEQRNAYMSALYELNDFALWRQDVELAKVLTAEIRANRHPRDAWALGNAAQSWFYYGRFDEAIPLGRETLAVTNYGAARATLAAALYAQAATLTLDGKGKQGAPLIEEAKALGVRRSTILAEFEGRPDFAHLLFPLAKLVPEPFTRP